MPHTLKVDLALLDELDKSVYVKDIAVPDGVKVLVDLETAVATATPPAKEEEVAAPATETVDVTAIKTETEEKKEERDAKKEVAEK
jgi:hypothetical protein